MERWYKTVQSKKELIKRTYVRHNNDNNHHDNDDINSEIKCTKAYIKSHNLQSTPTTFY